MWWKKAFLLTCWGLLWGASDGAAKQLSYDGFLRLYHSHLDELIEVQYASGGQIDPKAMARLNQFMRSRDSGQIKEINPDLIRLIDHLQDHFGVDTVEVISGYRSPAYNRQLKSQGRGVADKSNHILGWAADIHFDEITEKALMKYARSLKRGGVGYYPDLNMVHVDVGRVHFWQEGRFSNRTDIGIINPDVDLRVKTDRLFYLSHQKQKLTMTPPWPDKVTLVLEHFYRGQWHEKHRLPAAKRSPVSKIQLTSLRPRRLPYGKFRWKVLTQDNTVQYSNEFYLKKQ